MMKKRICSLFFAVSTVTPLTIYPVYGEEIQETEEQATVYQIHVTDGICDMNEAEEGTEITVTGLDKTNYQFEGWYENEEIVSTEQTYVFIMPDHDVDITGKYVFITGWYDNRYYTDENTYVKEQWMTIDGKQYYFDAKGNKLVSVWKDGHYLSKDGVMIINNWITANNHKYYVNKDGNKVTGLQTIQNQKYFFNKNGELQTGWISLNHQWYYANKEGKIQTGWIKSNNQWYYLKKDGVMAKGWQSVNNTWYFLKDSGAMYTGWLKRGNTWYYLKPSGAMVTNWQKINNKWYYFTSSGAMATGWRLVSGKWYYLDPANGDMKTGWIKVKNSWYYMHSSGAMLTGWQTISGKKYYLKDNGAMATGSIRLGKITYYFNAGGALNGLEHSGVPYYAQNDSRWANYRLGNYNAMRSTGCTPTAGASVVDYFNGSSYTPADIAKLFYDWGDYNKNYGHGSASTCWRKFANHFGLSFQNNMSYQNIKDALLEGKVCVAAMGNGYFAGMSYTHSICFFGIRNDKTYVYDPLNSKLNGWYSIRDIYNQRASLWLDNLDGGPVYALGK